MANEVSKYSKAPTLDRIRASYGGEDIELTPKEIELKNKYRRAFALILNMYSVVQTARHLVDEFNVSEATAFRYVKDAMTLYGSVADVDARGLKIQAREAYWTLYQMCLKKKDIDGARKNLDSWNKLNPSEDSQLFDPEKHGASQYNIVMDKELEELIKKNIQKGVVDFNDLEGIEDIEFKDVTEDED